MSLDGNYSTINQNISYFKVEEGISSRIIVSIPYQKYDTGITGGDVIFFDNSSGPVNGTYRKSKADSPNIAEVFGIVESSNGDTGDINVVISGSINLPTRNIFNTNNSPLNLGSNDVYFLSGQTAGALENYPPTTENYIIKPIYLNAPHGSFTGLVRNYLGFKNPETFSPVQTLSTFSEDMSKSLTYNETTQRFIIYDITYSSNTFNSTEKYVFDKFDLEIAASQNIDFLLTSDYDSKISDDGKHILLFGKPSKKIYYIYINNLNDIQLKATIDVDLVGNPDDLLWAVDNEVTCFTVGTRSLDRAADRYDTQINAYQLSSKIEYWKRNVNNTSSPFRWRRTFNQQAFGNVDSKPLSFNSENSISFLDTYIDGGLHRVNDIFCKNKNFCLSCITLIEDQISYKSKIAPFTYLRYDDDIFNLQYTEGLTNMVNPINDDIISIPAATNISVNSNHTENADLPENKKYCCTFGIDQFRILNKINNYYHEDMSYKKKNFRYDMVAALPSNLVSGTNAYGYNDYGSGGINWSRPGRTLSNSIKQLNQLTSLQQTTDVIFNFESIESVGLFTRPYYSRNGLVSRCCSTDTFSLFAFLYEYQHEGDVNKKQLIITKYPFNAFDNLNVFYHYSPSEVHKRLLPDDGTGYGYITSFKSTDLGLTFNGQYASRLGAGYGTEKIPCSFSTDQTITSININSLNNFSFWCSNERFFIITSNKVLIWEFASSTYNIIDYDNLDKANFYNNNDGEFFVLNNFVFRYNSSTISFDIQDLN